MSLNVNFFFNVIIFELLAEFDFSCKSKTSTGDNARLNIGGGMFLFSLFYVDFLLLNKYEVWCVCCSASAEQSSVQCMNECMTKTKMRISGNKCSRP